MENDPLGLSAWARFTGGLRMIGGGFETAVGYTLAVASGTAAVATSATVVGAVGFGFLAAGGATVGAHGVDTFQAGVRQLFTGEHTDSMTSTNLQAAGMSPRAANLTDAGISVVGSLGAGLATTGVRVVTLSATAAPEVAGASLLTKIKYYEAGQTSFPGSVFNATYANIPNTLDRGAQILADYGSLLGVAKAGSTTFGLAENTLRFGPTPLASGALGSALGGAGTASGCRR